jgi:hypothetical protein
MAQIEKPPAFARGARLRQSPFDHVVPPYQDVYECTYLVFGHRMQRLLGLVAIQRKSLEVGAVNADEALSVTQALRDGSTWARNSRRNSSEAVRRKTFRC